MADYGPSIAVLRKRRDGKLKQLAQIGPFVQGSLVSVKHKRCKHVAILVDGVSLVTLSRRPEESRPRRASLAVPG